MTGAALAVRQEMDRVPPVVGDAGAALATSWLLCRAAAILCALPLGYVREIMRVLPLEQLAGAPTYIRGLSVIRGAAVPVVDLGLLVAGRTSLSSRLVTMATGGRTIALAVDEVTGVTALGEALEAMPSILQQTAADVIEAIGARDSDFIMALRGGRLISEDLLAHVDPGG